MNHITVGVYLSDNFKWNCVKEEDLQDHINFNKTFRFGRALFVDGKCVYKGYLNEEKVKEWEDKISKMKFDNSVPTLPYR